MPLSADFFSGQYAKFTLGGSCVAETDGWAFSRECILEEIATCSSPGTGGVVNFPGRKRHSGTAKGVLRQGDEIENYFDEGDEVSARFYYSATKYWGGTIIIGKIDIEEVDIKEGKAIRWNVDWKAQGLLAKF